MEVSYIQATEIREKLCKILYFYRGANAVVLTQVFNGSLSYTTQQKKQITNQLVRLKEARIVTSKKLEGKDAGSMYFLSTIGLELVYKLLNITPLQAGTMWQQYPLKDINHEGLKEYDYDTYKPPIKQYAHHHLILQSIIQLFGKNSDLPSYPFRLTLDAVKKYMYNNQERLLKPDVEIMVGDEIFTLEIDRGTEFYSQLVAKFKNYKNYLDYASKENEESPITKIIFVFEDKNSNHGVSRRFETIMKAFLEGMDIKTDPIRWPAIELLYVNLSNLSEIFNYLQIRSSIDFEKVVNETYLHKITPIVEEPLIEFEPYENCSILAVSETYKQFVLVSYFPCFTSDFYRQILMFKYEKKGKYANYTKRVPIIINPHKKDNWNLNWKNTNIDYGVKYELDYIFNLAQFLTE